MKVAHFQIQVIYIIANYTSIYQCTDVILKQPFKHNLGNNSTSIS
jgi:hypothetical protein